MKVKRLNASNQRKKHLKQQHQKVNLRRISFFSQAQHHTLSQESVS
ncbi:MAG: hypothetical protein ACPGTQ_01995 [Colwellia sp.]